VLPQFPWNWHSCEESPLSYVYIREQQQQDNKLRALPAEKYPDNNYYYDKLDDDVEDIICY
jgi:hypothetical protein